MEDGKQYPNRYEAWMDHIVDSELPDFDTNRYKVWLHGVNRESVLCAPLFAEPLPPNPKPGVVAVDGDIVIATENPGGNGEGTGQHQGPTNVNSHFRSRKPKAERPSRQVKPAQRAAPLAKKKKDTKAPRPTSVGKENLPSSRQLTVIPTAPDDDQPPPLID